MSQVFPSSTLGELQEDLEHHGEVRPHMVERCLSKTHNCLGPSKNTAKSISRFKGGLFVVGCSPSCASITKLPDQEFIEDRKLILKAAISTNHIHLVAWIKKSDHWIFYDGMETPMLQRKSGADIMRIERQSKIACLVCEVDGDDALVKKKQVRQQQVAELFDSESDGSVRELEESVGEDEGNGMFNDSDSEKNVTEDEDEECVAEEDVTPSEFLMAFRQKRLHCTNFFCPT